MGKYAAAAKKAREATEAEYASLISSITSLNDAEIKKLFPERADKDKLVELLNIVNEATDDNDAINKLTKNIGTLAGTVVKLVKFVI
jgi:hypothetical protein